MERFLFETVHSKEFIEKWKNILVSLYGYEVFMDFVIVPSLFRGYTLSYLPLLNYTDRLATEIDDLLELGKDNKYQIRVLNPQYSNFKNGDTVDMRVDVSSRDLEYISKNIFSSRKCRNQIKKSQKSGLQTLSGNDLKLIDDFYELYKMNMHYHGTPIFDKKLFMLISENMQCDFVVTYKDDVAVSSVVILYDNDIALAMWAGIDHAYMEFCPNHNMYWVAVELAIKREKKIFDFGRSGYGGTTYGFKAQWGAVPIKIDIIKPNAENIYSKYETAANVWKKLPTKMTEYIGPKLCKYLEDL